MTPDPVPEQPEPKRLEPKRLERERLATACRICAVGCGTFVDVVGTRVVKVSGDPDDPWSLGYTCSKGRAGPEFHNDPDRLDTPLVRRKGQLVPVGWDEALDDIASITAGIVAEHGAGTIANYVGTGGPLDPLGYAVAHGFFRALGSDQSYERAEHRLLGQVPGAATGERGPDDVPARPGAGLAPPGRRREHRGVARARADDAQPARAPARPSCPRRQGRGDRPASHRDGPQRRSPRAGAAGHRSRAAGLPGPVGAGGGRRRRLPRRLRPTRQRRAAARPRRTVRAHSGGVGVRRPRGHARGAGRRRPRRRPRRRRDRHGRVDEPLRQPHRVAGVVPERRHRQPRP